jgi:hypothetical protein
LLPLAAASSHPGLLAIVVALGFIIGAYGHIQKSRTLIITGLIIIGTISAYFVILSQAGHPL